MITIAPERSKSSLSASLLKYRHGRRPLRERKELVAEEHENRHMEGNISIYEVLSTIIYLYLKHH